MSLSTLTRSALAATVLVGGSLFAVAPADAAPQWKSAYGAHQEEMDGCDHGATSKPCRPDPQAPHGKDCLKHGKHGGINEDHCGPAVKETTPAPTPTPTNDHETS